MAVVAIIPARYASTRFPGKPLALLGGRPMIQHVYERASEASGLDRVLVATDDERIFRAVKAFGGEAVMTSSAHQSGTDRVAEAARRLKANWIVNLQGDLPLIKAQTIAQTVKPVLKDATIVMSTAKTAIASAGEWSNPNVVKVVTDAAGRALYFSRAPIPFRREPGGEPGRAPWGYRHLGVYVYRRDFLFRFARLRPAPLERTEGLEQLRALTYGYPIRVVEVEEPAVEVDTPEDLKKAQAYLESRDGDRRLQRAH
ncbi:MAG TPA: 3-deoxy-manno-octulosonate cytidylyltransferase [Candidatus Acidoferrales bacterium]|nr:3-deoxy-manno-octulosonate cytidylyltransferase [Candidatus Acidoferrales bacterium]